MKSIVTITSDHDAHIPFVQSHLEQEMIVITGESILARHELSYYVGENGTEVVFKGDPLHDVSAVWYRKPNSFSRVDVPVHKTFEKYARTSLDGHLNQLRVQFHEATWVSDYYALARAENKTLQLRLASKLGFKIPETLFTSDVKAARDFLNEHQTAVVKTMARAFPSDDTQSYYFFARKITKHDAPIIRNLHLAPAIIQRAVEPAADLRVTVVGNQAFAAQVIVNEEDKDAPVRDWRRDYHYDKVKFSKYVLPSGIKTACIELVKDLGLRFGAIDLVIDKENQIWFLEINPNGQWAFVEVDTGLPIGRAIELQCLNPPTR